MEFGEIILSILGTGGIISAVIGVTVKKIATNISKTMEARETAKEAMLGQMVKATWASIALGEATAKAVQRIPDAHCNGDMSKALEYATQVKHEQKEFFAEQGIHALW